MVRKPHARYDVTAEQLCEVWQSSATADEAARRLNMPKPVLLARVCNYRARGVQLKTMPRNRRSVVLDVDALNRRIAELGGDANARPPRPRRDVRLSDEEAASHVRRVLESLGH